MACDPIVRSASCCSSGMALARSQTIIPLSLNLEQPERE